MPDCIFCQIAAHQAPATIRYEDEHVVAFDALPGAMPFHVLVIPRRHVPSVADLEDADLAGRLILTATRLVKEGGHGGRFRLATNSGAPIQDVFHLHWHVMAGAPMGHAAGVSFNRRPDDPRPN